MFCKGLVYQVIQTTRRGIGRDVTLPKPRLKLGDFRVAQLFDRGFDLLDSAHAGTVENLEKFASRRCSIEQPQNVDSTMMRNRFYPIRFAIESSRPN